MDTNSVEFKAALRDHAKSLGVDPDAEPHLLALVEEALLADIPEGWEQGETEDGTLYYFNTATEESIWEHPLDAHYRELIQTKKSEHAAASSSRTSSRSSSDSAAATESSSAKAEPALTTTTTPISSVEVYSFDEDSDDDVTAPATKTSTGVAAKESDKTSRIASLFPQPVPSFSSTAAAMASSSREAESSSGASSSASALGTSSKAATGASAASGGFGRDRSWLLDTDDDDSVVVPTTLGRSTTSSRASPATTTPVATPQSSRSDSYGGRDDSLYGASRSVFSTSAPRSGAAASSASTSSFSSRMYGSNGASAATTLSSGLATTGVAGSTATTTTSSSVTMLMDISGTSSAAGGSSASTSPTQSKGASPRRGLGSSVKNQFFNDLSTGAATSSASQALTSPGLTTTSLPADVAKIQQLEKRVSELMTQTEQLTADSQKLRQQLEHAQLEAKESNYLKMKANESKVKLADKDAELARVAQDHAAAVAKLQQELTHVTAERERLTANQVQLASSSSQEVLEMQRSAATLATEKAALQQTLSDLERKLRDAQQDAAAQQTRSRELEATLERTRSEHVRELSALRDALEQRRKDQDKALQQQRSEHDAVVQQVRTQLDAAKREVQDTERRSESVGVLQDTLDRQNKFVKELEEKSRELQSKLALAEEREAAARRDVAQREIECADATRKSAAALAALETKEQQLSALSEKLRLQIEQTASTEARAAGWQRQEDELKREQAALERARRDLANDLRDKSHEVEKLQSQLRKQSDEHESAVSKLQLELQDAHSQLRALKLQELAPLVKQCEQLQRELERVTERLTLQDKDHRQTKHELTTSANQIHQLQVEIEAWKRKEQQQRAQRELVLHEKAVLEKHAASVEAEHSNYKTTKRLELEKLTFRMRELESLVTQKDYEILRVEERFTKAEAWRLKEARRVEERDSQLLDVKEELAQLKSRNVDAENNVVIQELRRERDELQHRVAQVTTQLEDEKLARHVSGQKFQDELEMMQKGLEWQLPQLAAACVNRSSEEWTRKCQAVVKALRDDFHMQALTERNELLRKVQSAEDAREHVEQKYKNIVAECDFLRKEVHRVEDNNKVLLDQLHTVRVYMTQRSVPPHMMPGGSAFAPTAPWPAHQHHHPSSSSAAGGVHPSMFAPFGAPPPQPSATAAPPPPPSSSFGAPFTDFSTVNHLNTQLGILHAQFQQLFDATERRPPSIAIPKHVHIAHRQSPQFSPSDRFEIPTSPLASAATKRSREVSTELDETVDVLLDQSLESSSSATAAANRSKELEKEQLLSSLEALEPASGVLPPSPATSAGLLIANGDPLAGTRDASSSSSVWYQKDYWRSKYQ